MCHVVNKTSWKGIVRKKKAAVCHKYNQRPMSFCKKRENVVHSRKCAPEDASTDMQPKLKLTGSYNKGINGNKEVHQERFSRPFFENWPCRRQRRIWGTSAWSPLEPAEMAEASVDTQANAGAEQCLKG